MTALALIEPGPGLRLYRIVGPCMEPDLRGGDFLMVREVRRFLYDATYLLDFGHGEAPFLASGRIAGGVAIRHRNPLFSTTEISRPDFNRAVRGIVVAEVKVKDETLMLADRQAVAA